MEQTTPILDRSIDFSSLPTEILAKVLALLSQRDWAQAARTCKSFHAACDSVLQARKFLNLKNAGAAMNDHCFGSLANKIGCRLRRMELDCWHLSDSSLLNLPKSVEELALCGCDHHSDSILFHVVERLSSRLKLFAWSGFGGSVSAIGFEVLAHGCRNITSFMIDAGASVDVNHVVCTVAKNCPLLSELSAYDLTMETLNVISNCNLPLKRLRHKRRHDGGFSITDATLLALCRICPALEELHLVDKANVNLSGELTDVGLLALSERSPTLHTLKIKLASSGSAELCSEVAIMELMSVCSKATHIELSNFKCLSDPPIYELIQRLPILTDLSLEGTMITDSSMELLANYCRHLRQISVKGCKRLTDAGLKSLGQCGNLEAVNAGQTSGLTDGAAAAICAGNRRLKTIVFSYGQISDKALKAVSMYSQTQELALNNCSRISNVGLGMLAESCPLLRYISLSYCEHISDSGVVALARGCPQLQKVRLDGCRFLSNPSVGALCKNNPKLRYLSMQHCVKLSDVVFQYLIDAPAIRFVDLGRAKLTATAIENFHHRRPLVELFIDGRVFSSF